ncbi:hypothetical protein EV195_102243 [Tenacibaculum skagerrakense]|uniref:Uncharacterized protein n=1 Tax=Tenacibaculum skagerrakense TaxID=186571 RepID=A0A4R2NZE0_9FLAO|nr:hypothetical protein [Tenacibaculum skagerrakense]TCP26901.1 hypothetical protein EV195_102243 [Tenacibaculum skagerrakense]
MNKKIASLLFALLSFGLLNAQDSAMDKMAMEICEYFTKNEQEFKNMSTDDLTAKLGVQMVQSYLKYQDDLAKEGIKFDLTKGRAEGEKMGAKVGVGMIKFCPDVLMAIAGDEDYEEEATESYLEGTLKKVTGEDLYVVEVKDTDGKTQKFVWLTNFEGSDKLIELGKEVKGVKVGITYTNLEYFSPKLKKYIVRKKITRLEFLN